MTINSVITIIIAVVALMFLACGVYVYLRNKTMEEIRAEVYDLFLQAEHTYTETSAGKQKMKWVIGKARLLLPEWLQTFVTDEFLYKVIEGWFRAVKDLLDDGKYNKSVE